MRDVAVINAYVRRRQIIEEESTKADALAPTGDVERDKRAKKRYSTYFHGNNLLTVDVFQT